MAILANKNLRKKYVNLDKTKIATKVRKLEKWKELLTNCWHKTRFPIVPGLYRLYIDKNANKILK